MIFDVGEEVFGILLITSVTVALCTIPGCTPILVE